MPLTKTNLNAFPDVSKYLSTYFPKCMDLLKNIDIVKVSSDLWTKFNFEGYGYLVRKENMEANYYMLEAYSSPELYKTLPTKEHKRDVNIYKILKQLNKPNLFILVIDNPNSKYFILHELSHICGIDESFTYNFKFNDAYLDEKSEQSAYLSEMRYAQQEGMSYEDYFKMSFPKESEILSYKGKQNLDKELYDYAMMDFRDYKTMWDSIK